MSTRGTSRSVPVSHRQPIDTRGQVLRRWHAAVVGASLVLALAGCASGNSPVATTPRSSPSLAGTGGSSPGPLLTPAETPAASASPTPRATLETSVRLSKFLFVPVTLRIAPGTTVTFVNLDPVEHTATEGKDGFAAARPAFDLRIPIGQSRRFTFTVAKTYLVTCLIHPSMNMTIVVR